MNKDSKILSPRLLGLIAVVFLLSIAGPLVGASAAQSISDSSSINATPAESGADADHIVQIEVDEDFTAAEELNEIIIDYSDTNNPASLDLSGFSDVAPGSDLDDDDDYKIFVDGDRIDTGATGAGTATVDDGANTITLGDLSSFSNTPNTQLESGETITVVLGDGTTDINNPDSSTNVQFTVSTSSDSETATTQLDIDGDAPINVQGGNNHTIMSAALGDSALSDGSADTITIRSNVDNTDPSGSNPFGLTSDGTLGADDVTIEGSGSPSVTSDATNIVDLAGNDDITIDGVKFDGNGQTASTAIKATSSASDNVQVTANEFTGLGGVAVDLGSTASTGDLFVLNNTFVDATTGQDVVDIDLADGTASVANVSTNTFQSGINTDGVIDVDLNNQDSTTNITANTFESAFEFADSAAEAVDIGSAGGATHDVNVVDNTFAAPDSNPGDEYILIDGSTNIDTTTVSNNSIAFHSSYGSKAIDINNAGDVNLNASGAEVGGSNGNNNLAAEVSPGSSAAVTIDGFAVNNADDGVQVLDGDTISVSSVNMTNVNGGTTGDNNAAIDLSSSSASTIDVTGLELNSVSADHGLIVSEAGSQSQGATTITNVTGDDVSGTTAIILDSNSIRAPSVTGISLTNLDAVGVEVSDIEDGEGSPTLSNLTFDGNGQDTGIGLDFTDNSPMNTDVVVDDLTATNLTKVVDMTQDGVQDRNRFEVTNFEFTNITTGIDIDTSDSDIRTAKITDGTVNGVFGTGNGVVRVGDLDADPSAKAVVSNVTVTNDNNAGNGVGITVDNSNDMGNLTLSDVSVDNVSDGIDLDVDAQVDPNQAGLTISNVDSTNNNAYGIRVSSSGTFNTDKFALDGADISGNDNGLVVASGASFNSIELTNLNADDAGTTGIDINDGATDTVNVTSVSANNGTDGLVVSGSNSKVDLNVADSDFSEHSNDGLQLTGTVERLVDVDNTTFENNGQDGISLTTNTNSDLNVSNSLINNNSRHGITADIGGASLDKSTIVHNDFTKNTDAAISLSDADGTINATHNYWGDVTGPNVTDSGGSMLNDRHSAGQNITEGVVDGNTDGGSLNVVPFVDSSDNVVYGFEGVIDDDGGSPLSDTQATLNYVAQNADIDSSFTFTTSNNGEYVAVVSEHQSSDFYDVTANANGFAESDSKTVTIDGQTSDNSGTFIASKDLALNSGSTLNGTINQTNGALTDVDNIELINAANDNVLDSNVSTDSNGVYSTSITPDTYDLRVNHPDFDSSTVATGVVLTSGNETNQSFTLRQDTTADFTANVTFANGSAIANTDVTFSGSSGVPSSNDASLPVTKTTNSSGIVQFEIPASSSNDAYTITADASGFQSSNTGVAPAPGDSVSRTFTLQEETGPSPTGSVTFRDQTVSNGSETVRIESANYTLADGNDGDYVVVVHNVTSDGSTGAKVGVSANQTGSASGFDVDLNASGLQGDAIDTLTENVTLRAMLHETSSDGAFGPSLGLATDTANITVSEDPLPADFDVSNVTPDGQNVTVGDSIDVSADIENVGGQSGTQTVSFRIDTDENGTLEADEELDNASVTLNASETTTVNFTNIDTSTLDTNTTYTHGVVSDNATATATITVEEDAPAYYTLKFPNSIADRGVQTTTISTFSTHRQSGSTALLPHSVYRYTRTHTGGLR